MSAETTRVEAESRYFPPRRNFSSLSLADLLAAREAYHVHLAHIETVIGTAVGRYLIRKNEADDWKRDRSSVNLPPRTLATTVVRPWSWPCVLVFVNKWLTRDDLRKNPDQAVPRFLYLADGRIVPTCVVLAEEAPAQKATHVPSFTSDLLGGGYAVLTDVQGQEHLGSIACLVTDGDRTFALTNHHVTGSEGREISSIIRGRRERIGRSAQIDVGKLPFGDVYREWPAERAFLTLDAGLIEVDDVNSWTAQVFGIGELGTPANLNTDTISLDLIGCPVRAFGAASGTLEGRVKALFYRYRSIGGFDYIADVLIGPRERKSLPTVPGDSGTLWCFDPPVENGDRSVDWESERFAVKHVDRGRHARRLRPLALQWGGQTLLGAAGEATTQFALATFLSTICRELDVDVIRDWNIGHPEYWGKIGHFKIGASACDLTTGPLRALLQPNKLLIGVADDNLEEGRKFSVSKDGFIPLADVPDYVWISMGHMKSAAAARKNEGPQHFADMDQEGSSAFPGQTLLDLVKDPANISADVWDRFYNGFPPDDAPSFGALPFRVWQIFDEMVKYRRDGKILEFVACAGVMAHYVGDACQPLHISKLHHGHMPSGAKARAEYKKTSANQIHALYEERMFEEKPAEMLGFINTALKGKKAEVIASTGYEAALAVVALMQRTFAAIPPEKIVDADDPDQKPKARAVHLFDEFGEATGERIADGITVLASLWQSAWSQSKSAAPAASITQAKLQSLYKRPTFLPALTLKEMAAHGLIAPKGKKSAKKKTTPKRTGSRRRSAKK